MARELGKWPEGLHDSLDEFVPPTAPRRAPNGSRLETICGTQSGRKRHTVVNTDGVGKRFGLIRVHALLAEPVLEHDGGNCAVWDVGDPPLQRLRRRTFGPLPLERWRCLTYVVKCD